MQKLYHWRKSRSPLKLFLSECHIKVLVGNQSHFLRRISHMSCINEISWSIIDSNDSTSRKVDHQLWSYGNVNDVKRSISRYRTCNNMVSNAFHREWIIRSFSSKFIPTNSILPQRMVSEPCSNTKLIGLANVQKTVISHLYQNLPLAFNWLDSQSVAGNQIIAGKLHTSFIISHWFKFKVLRLQLTSSVTSL